MESLILWIVISAAVIMTLRKVFQILRGETNACCGTTDCRQCHKASPIARKAPPSDKQQ